MTKTLCAHALCFIGNKETGSTLQALIEQNELLNAVIADQNVNVFDKMREVNPIMALVEDIPGKIDGIKLVYNIRRSQRCPNIHIPTILILNEATTGRVIDSSISGTNQIITAPFSSTKLWECFELALKDNRRFIETEQYVGPERRGKSSNGFTDKERRRGSPTNVTLAIRRTESQDKEESSEDSSTPKQKKMPRDKSFSEPFRYEA